MKREIAQGSVAQLPRRTETCAAPLFRSSVIGYMSWPPFRAFALSASFEDAGAAAASEHLQLDLGESVVAIFEQASAEGWRPDPKKWSGEVAHTPE